MSTPTPDIQIRPLTTLAQMAPLAALQQAIWAMSPRETVPAHHFHALVDSGNSVLGAYADGRLVGFVLSTLGAIPTPGRIDKVAAARLKLLSVMMGVHPDYRGRGIAYQLKLAQRDFAQKLGIRLITWTFDPLLSRNGWLNIGKLGAVCHDYRRNYHGDMDGINAGLATDRFAVQWWLTSSRVESRVSRQRKGLSLAALLGGGARIVNAAEVDGNGRLAPPETTTTTPDATLLLAEIPANFAAIKQADMDLAQRWRHHTRHLYETYFNQGYVVTDFVHEPDEAGVARSYYLLTQGRGA